MYVLVRVEYDYHRFQENVGVFEYISDVIDDFPEFEMYNPESERKEFFDHAELPHFWVQSFSSYETTAKAWWFSLLHSDNVRILELYDGKALSSTRVYPELDDLTNLWDFHNNNYNKQ